MNLTSTEIFKLVWDRIRDSLLGKTVPMMYADHYPNNPSGEFIVVGSLSNVVGDSQVATVNVNIYIIAKFICTDSNIQMCIFS